ncbi:MAG: type II toxin-antitoxin system death-on-curing family toxin [Bacteroidetes bacterium]|nr:type II toxin-antitoxin system death-on-curing family toxin [Bacteroidota bacterium]
MKEIYTDKNERIAILEKGEILKLHKILSENYHLLPEMEPVSPSGIKDDNLLESAISRQLTGSGDYYKYNDMYLNCASLVFGIVKNHSFHNGNKRMGFLVMLKHLYSNGKVIAPDVSHIEIFQLLRDLAGNTLNNHAEEYYPKYIKVKRIGKNIEWETDICVDYVAFWLRHKAVPKTQKIKKQTIPLNELINILNRKNLIASYDGKSIRVSKKPRLLEKYFINVFNKTYETRNDKQVNLSLVEIIRKDFNLSHLDGVDNVIFYDDENDLNEAITQYRKIIYKLAKI